MKSIKFFCLIFSFCVVSAAVRAAVAPEYADNSYSNHELTRAEKKCLDEGYKITYANCSNQTAPADQCPHHKSYYRTCSQEQWCRNNNFRFLKEDCKLPLYPLKMCDNQFPLYRTCQENVIKACEDSGFKSKDECKLTDKRCPYSKDYGICCGKCEDFSHILKQIPAGYVPTGETCTTCGGITKTNIKPAPCKGFQMCQYGPMSPQTPRCRQADKVLYSACKTADTVCKEKGYTHTTCKATEDAMDCPENPVYKTCITNCFKLAVSLNPDSEILPWDAQNPVIDLTKKSLKSLIGMEHPGCSKQQRPVIEININKKQLEQYQNLFEHDIENLAFKINFEESVSLPINGKLKNVKVTFSGKVPEFPIKGEKAVVSGVVSFVNAPNLCTNFVVEPNSKLITSGNIRGNVNLGRDSSLGVKGDLLGYLKAGSYTEVLIKGKLEYNDPLNSDADSESIVFGCNSKNKIEKGIVADTSSIVVKQYGKLDAANILLKSTSDNLQLPNTLGSIHLHKYTKLFSTYGNEGEDTIFPLMNNDGNTKDCDDKYYVHIGSAVDQNQQTMSIEPSNRLEDKWQCRKLRSKQMECD